MSRIRQALQHYFGFGEFRHQQEAIIEHILSGKDALVLMPTGGGKSVCYQLPALMLDGVTVVVSPLIALMKDQVDALRQNGIPAAFLNSTLSSREQDEIMRQMKSGELKLLYVAPERLLGKADFLTFLKDKNVSLFAIDEAHCISQWGHDFRPEYLALGQLIEALPGVPVIALTATADKLTREDIINKLGLRQYRVFEDSFNRPNIFYQVLPKRAYEDQIIQYLQAHKEDSGIIYCLSRAGTEDLAEQLRVAGFAAMAYHAGLEKYEREKRQNGFQRDEVRIIVATIAFGMGIDKSNVRFVIHADMPKNIEGYYQETGRAGRDGLPSDAILFYSYADVSKLKNFCYIEGNPEQTRILNRKLDQMTQFCTISTCRRKYLLTYFGEMPPDHCGACDVCRTKYERADATIPAQKFLSAVARLGGRFGMHYVVDLLRGSTTTRPEHQSLKTYKAGADISKAQWLQYGHELLQLGYVKQTEDRYPVLQLTDKSWPVLRSEETVMLIAATKKLEDKPAKPAEAIITYPALLHQLKVLRKTLADEQDVPAFVIFSDASLVEMSNYIPLSLQDLRQITGFGDVKLARYGDAFLEVLKTFAAEHQLNSLMHQKPGKAKPIVKEDKQKITATMRESFNFYRSGNSIEKIAAIRDLTINTIEGHLASFVYSGELDVKELVSEEKIKIISNAIDQHGILALSPIKQEVGEGVSYGEIRLVIAYWEQVRG